MLSDLTAKLLKATEELHRVACEFEEDEPSAYSDVLVAWSDAAYDVEKATGLDADSIAMPPPIKTVRLVAKVKEVEAADFFTAAGDVPPQPEPFITKDGIKVRGTNPSAWIKS